MHPEYEQHITGTLKLQAWHRVKAALDEQGRYAITEYTGSRDPLTVCCKHCGELSTVKMARSFQKWGHCNACRRRENIKKLMTALEETGRTWLNEDEFTSLSHSMVHTRCIVCGHESTQSSGNIFYSNYGCPGECFKKKMSVIQQAASAKIGKTNAARGLAHFERVIRKQNRIMVGTYERQRVKVAVKCLSCGTVSDVMPYVVVQRGTDCQVCEPKRRKRIVDTKKTIGINMSADLATELERRAEAMDISTSKYCKIIFQQWIESGKKLKLQEQ